MPEIVFLPDHVSVKVSQVRPFKRLAEVPASC